MQQEKPFSIIQNYELVAKRKPTFRNRNNLFAKGKSSLNTSQLLAFYTLFILDKNMTKSSHQQEEIYGLYIFNEMTSMIDSSWGMSHSCLYPVLARLESEGLIMSKKSTLKSNRRVYEITENGKREFKLQKKTYHQELLSSCVFYQQIMSRIYTK